MSQKSLWTFKLIIKVLFLKLQPILWCTHPPKKTNFFKVAKLTVCNILLTREKYLVTLAVNRPTCSQLLCAILCNLLHYCPCYGKTRVWGRYNVYFWLSGQRVNVWTEFHALQWRVAWINTSLMVSCRDFQHTPMQICTLPLLRKPFFVFSILEVLFSWSKNSIIHVPLLIDHNLRKHEFHWWVRIRVLSYFQIKLRAQRKRKLICVIANKDGECTFNSQLQATIKMMSFKVFLKEQTVWH